ncbi:MAG TPA: PAC2 family protein [Nitrososphaera sp.]|jgi:uncharacterized protein|nr:PAC2 family protein [Nitrososphaera sp.]
MSASSQSDLAASSWRDGRTSIRPVERNKQIKLDDAILVAGFPGPGLVGSMSASYIIEQQKMHQIAYVDSDYIMPGVMFIGGRLRHPFRIYSNDEGDVCVVVCDAPIVLAGIRQVLNTVVRWAHERNVREIMVLEGIAATDIPQDERKAVIMSSDGRSDDHGFLSRMHRKGSEEAPSGHPAFITGISGALLASCLSNGIPCTGILLAAPSGIPDPEGAAILIETANRIASNPFKIDVGQLKNEAVELKKQMQQLINAMQKQQQDAVQVGGGQGIYS